MYIRQLDSTCSMFELSDLESHEIVTKGDVEVLIDKYVDSKDIKTLIYNTNHSMRSKVCKSLLERGFVEVFRYKGNNYKNGVRQTVRTLMLDVSKLK